MSGEIFHPLESLEGLDVTRWNPLLCYLCNEKYDDPCILGCYHTFCSRCLYGRASDGKMTCPLCRSVTTLRDAEQLPPTDRLMKFLVNSSCEEREQCANCDMAQDQMYFCNTCKQALCGICREETHTAKMFSRHDVVVLSKRTKEIHRECPHHHEPYILFSTEKKTMLCINCFRDMKVESRSFCVDMETAYNQGCKKLDNSMLAIRELQNSVRDSIMLLRALLEEVVQNAEVEKTAILELFDKMIKETTQKKDSLLEAADKQYQEKESLFKEELSSLSTLLPTLHTHLVTSAAFSSSANKFEFLDLAYILMERLKSIITRQHPLHPSQGSQICTDFRAQFASCLEPLLFPHRSTSKAAGPSLTVSSTTPRLELSSMESALTNVRLGDRYSAHLFSSAGRRFPKVKVTEGKGAFADHCREFDSSHKDLTILVERLKNQLQELQRDLTLRRCLTRSTSVEELQLRIENVEKELDSHKSRVEQKQTVLEKHWEEALQKIAGEQDIYQAQLQDVMRVQQETSHLRTMLNQLSRFVTSITAVTERLAPKLASSKRESEHESSVAALFEQISTMQPDSQHRVEAIRTAEEERESLSTYRVNPLDEQLIKTKGMLKAPSARRDGVSRRDSTKRDSKEMKDLENKESSKSPESKQSMSSEKQSSDISKETTDVDNSQRQKISTDDDSTQKSPSSLKKVETDNLKAVLDKQMKTDLESEESEITLTTDTTTDAVSNDKHCYAPGVNSDSCKSKSSSKSSKPGQETNVKAKHLYSEEGTTDCSKDRDHTSKISNKENERTEDCSESQELSFSEEREKDTKHGETNKATSDETPEEEMTGGESLMSRIERLRGFVERSNENPDVDTSESATPRPRKQKSSKDRRRERNSESRSSKES